MQRPHRRLHALAWMLIAVALPVGLVVALLVRPDPMREAAPVRLDAPGSPQVETKP